MDYANRMTAIEAEYHPSKNELPFGKLKPRSNRKVWWLCAEGHEWEAVVNNRTARGSNCPFCSGKKVWSGFNDICTTDPDILCEWDYSKNDLNPETISRSSKTGFWWVCRLCNRSWKTSPFHRLVDKTGCPSCRGRLRSLDKSESNHPEHLYSEWSPENKMSLDEYSTNSTYKAKWVCSEGHVWTTMIHLRSCKGYGCPVCAGKKVSMGHNDILTTHPYLVAEWDYERNRDLKPGQVTYGSKVPVWWVCSRGHSWRVTVNSRTSYNTGCPRCANTGTSRAEQDVYDFVKSLCPDAVFHDRSLAQGYEYDISVPSQKVAIEYNGVYWHTEKSKGQNYHRDKSLATDYQVIHIWEPDWLDRQEIVKRMLARKLHKSTEPRLNARQLTVRKSDMARTRDFLNQNHIQGATKGSVYLTLCNSEELVGVMVFQRRKDNEWELVRYATNAVVRGGFSKLFKHFIRTENPESIVSFSDIGVSDGGMYLQNGFERDGEIKPDYKYLIDGELKHKFGYRLKRFRNDPELEYQEGLTERELAEINGLERVYDCGKVRWLWTMVK